LRANKKQLKPSAAAAWISEKRHVTNTQECSLHMDFNKNSAEFENTLKSQTTRTLQQLQNHRKVP